MKQFYFFAKGTYLGCCNTTLDAVLIAFPYAVITNGCRVHIWSR
jgi:hypothetical protein